MPAPANYQRRIVCAALKHAQTGKVVLGIRHWDDMMREQAALQGGTHAWLCATEGFVDDRRQFLTRVEAFQVARAAGQIIYTMPPELVQAGELYSDYIY